MTDQESNNELRKLTASLAQSSKICSSTLSQLANQITSVSEVSKAIQGCSVFSQSQLSSIGGILEHINRTAPVSSSIRSMTAVNSAILQIAAQSPVARIAENQRRLQAMIEAAGVQPYISSAMAQIDLGRTLSTSLAAQTKLAGLEHLSLGRLVNVDHALNTAMSGNLSRLTSSYQALMEAAKTSTTLAPYLPIIKSFPPVEYYREISLLETMTIERDETDEIDQSIEAELDKSFPSADSLLEEFEPGLCRLLNGARQALEAGNPDKARHVTTSVRELFTQVLHKLAPDREFARWAADKPELYANGRPTRRGRLLYVCRNISAEPLANFVEHDVKAAVSFVDSLHSGTHAVESQLTVAQLGSIIVRIESLLVFLLQLPKK